MIAGDQNHTSTKLRQSAIEAIKEMQRPIAAHELERWIIDRKPDLWNEVAEKCYDYVRIILSLTPSSAIIKYRSHAAFPGVDKRAAFYGLPDGNYDSAIWHTIGRKHDHNPTRRTPSQRSQKYEQVVKAKEPLQDMNCSLFFPVTQVIPFKKDVSDSECYEAWFALTTLVPPNDSFWLTFLNAINIMKNGMQDRREPEMVLNEILEDSPSFAHPTIAADIVTILSKEAILKREAMWYELHTQ